MKNDLISRSELKKAVNDFFDNHFKGLVPNELITYAEAVDNAIDSTLTVEFTEEQAIDKLHETGWLIRHDKEMTERLQGEWIDYSNEGYVECPFCGSATNCEDNKDELHYCWNCGAEMRQEETKDDG